MKLHIPLEDYESEAFANWLRSKGLRFTHIPNETSSRNWGYTMKMKRLGKSSGVPDYMILTPKGIVFVEMKRIKKSKTSPEQAEWISAINKVPCAEGRVCLGHEEAIAFIKELI